MDNVQIPYYPKAGGVPSLKLEILHCEMIEICANEDKKIIEHTILAIIFLKMDEFVRL